MDLGPTGEDVKRTVRPVTNVITIKYESGLTDCVQTHWNVSVGADLPDPDDPVDQ